MKRAYSEPKIYCGGVDISQWRKLTKSVQANALQKDWYVYYSFRDPHTGKLHRQPNIKAGANRFKTKRLRYRHLRTIQQNLHILLEFGFNPYEDNSIRKQNFIKQHFSNSSLSVEEATEVVAPTTSKTDEKEEGLTIQQAIEFVLKQKRQILSENSYTNYQGRLKRFGKWLSTQFPDKTSIGDIQKKDVMAYLNHVLIQTSAGNRNNTRTDLSSFFQFLSDNEVVYNNVVRGIPILKSKPKKNKTYNGQLLSDIEQYLKKEDPVLFLFVRFISYTFLRPVEICRLKIKDIDLRENRISVNTKTKLNKVKILPEILLKELPDVSTMVPEHYLFTPNGIGYPWETGETQKRNYFSKRFKLVKDHFGLGPEYGLYSFRHTYITKLYQRLAEESSSIVAKEQLMPITGHQTIRALEKYLRDIDAELPEDYSHLYK